jgi:hypothetical protein
LDKFTCRFESSAWFTRVSITCDAIF